MPSLLTANYLQDPDSLHFTSSDVFPAPLCQSGTASNMNSADPASERAPKYFVPDQVAMTVEHPCIIKNMDRAYSMIGGQSAIARSLEAGPGAEAPLSLYFNPEDLASRPVVSMPRTANNILLQVTVPKRTGRKRKRGSAGPFEDPTDPVLRKDAQYLLQSIQDNPHSYSVEPLATISSTHVWRNMPDFVYSTAQSGFLNDLREKVLSKSYPLIKQYVLPQTYGLTNTEVIPPAQLSTTTIPTNYSYRSNPFIPLHTSPTTHHQTLYHATNARKNHAISVHWHHTFPTSPQPIPPLLKTLPLLATLRAIFTARPIWTRRALINQLPPNTPLTTLRSALPHIAFNIRSGPWRDTICAFGVDPRSSPEYRIYQTVTVVLGRKHGLDTSPAAEEDSDTNANVNAAPTGSWTRSASPTSHIFTGQGTIPPDGSTWQVCDITDPELASIVSIDEDVVEKSCEIKTRGFYPAGAWAKVKVGMRWKVEGMQGGDDEGIAGLLELPDVWDGEGVVGLDMPAGEGRWTVLWRATVREMIAREEKMAGVRRRRGALGQEVVNTGSVSTPDGVDTEAVPDDGNVFVDQDGEQEEESEIEEQGAEEENAEEENADEENAEEEEED